MNYLSICSGIEAASVAWHPLGWRAVAYAENTAFPSAVLAHHYQHTPNWGDITKFRDWPDAVVDVLVGGTPCQSFSIAGLRKGLADPRGNLALVYLGILDRYRPRWMVWENVPGVLSSNKGRDFGAFLGGLAELGYGFAYRVLDAQYFGLAQQRRRVFVVGHSGAGWQRAAAVLFEPESLSGHPAPRREAGTAAARPLAAGSPGGSGYRNDPDTAENLVAHALTTRAGNGSRGAGATGNLAVVRPQPGSAVDGRVTQPLNDLDGAAHALTATATATGHLDPTTQDLVGVGPIAFSAKDHGADAKVDLAPTLRAGGHDTSHANAGVMPAVAFDDGRQWQVRRLTPTECERLQGFPDGYTLIPLDGARRKAVEADFAAYINTQRDVQGLPPIAAAELARWSADGPRYKALGNSMAVPVMRWIGDGIAAVDAIPQTEGNA